MVLDRNNNMAEKINEYLKTDDTYFVITGVDHCVGTDSIINLLKNKGYKVERIK